ncbi:MAG TPA: hypothetical protein PKC49_05640 [Phycisphaerae bacterium]|nr:hypothetical protein [Phycisphaerae bacterium]
MEPWALAMFVSFALELRGAGVRVSPRLDPSNPSNRYLAAMDLPHVIETGTSTPRWDQSPQNTGLHVLRSHAEVSRFLESAALVEGGPSEAALNALRYGMAELGRNVIQHSQSATGGVAIAQHFPELGALQVAICDAGQGVRNSLHRNYPELRSDLESLKLAILPHSSGAAPAGPYGSGENAGLGLFFCKEICWRTGGSFWMASGEALLGVKDNDSSGRGRIYRRINPWPGTLVAMHLPDRFVVEFDELMTVCRELSKQARTNSAEAALDFVDERFEDERFEVPPGAIEIAVDPFLENVEKAREVRESQIHSALQDGRLVVLDFGGARFVTQSFAHALLYEAFKTPGSLTKLTFRRCTKSTEEALRLVAAYAKASYRQQEL